MAVSTRSLFLLAVMILTFAFNVEADELQRYEVGVSKIDITPDYPIRLNGFGGRREEAAEVRQRLWAKAMTIRSPGTESKPLVLLAIDNLGVRMDMVDRVASQLQQSHGIPRENVALTFTHTHCGPKVNGASDNIFSTPIPEDHQAHIDRYTSELEVHLVTVARQALDNQQRCTLKRSVGKVTFAVNRRTAGGPVDHDLPLLVATNEQDKIVAIYTSYACHCVALNENKLSGDWAGYAQEFIEREFPGSVALVSIGAGSDSNPNRRQSDETADVAVSLGLELATEVKRQMDGPFMEVEGEIKAELNRIALPLNDLPTREELQTTAAQGGAAGYNAQTHLDRLDAGHSLQSSIEYPIQNWRFGKGLAMIFLAGEVCVDYSHRIKRELNRDRLWINAYSNDFGCYIPSERLLKEGGYGGGSEIPYFALPTTLKAGLEQQIMDEIHRQMPDSFNLPDGTRGIPPKSPKLSLDRFKVHPRFKMELVASEPLVQDPVAIDFGPDGKLWVVEMPDYNYEVDEEFEPTGVVKFLVDDDGDGVMDRATTFASGFRFPMDVKCWNDGILVCDAPDIYFLHDSDDDGKADVKSKLFSGFETHNPHGRVNSLRWSVDGWIYGSCGLFGGTISTHEGDELALGARDFRILPSHGYIEPATGRSQQGRACDDWGNWFGCDNSNLLWHYPLSGSNVSRNDRVAPPTTMIRLIQDQTLFSPQNIVRYTLSGAPGVPTSACGLEIYRDNLLGDDVYGNSFTAEPVNQVIHRRTLSNRQHTFDATRHADESQSEFLSSDDQWFRPVQIRTGPDGAIWLVDMYRFVIEHKRWISEEDQKELDMFAGQRLGRIYRIIPAEKPLRDVPDFEEMTVEELISRLDHPNGVQRDTAHQQLVFRDERGLVDWDVMPSIEKVTTHAEHPAAKLHALSLLSQLQSLSPETLLAAMADSHSGVRRHAVTLSESIANDNTEVFDAVVRLTADDDFKVALQAVFTLGSVKNSETATALLNKFADSQNEYMNYAILCGMGEHNLAAVLEIVFADQESRFESIKTDLMQLAFEVNDPESMQLVLEHVMQNANAPEEWQLSMMTWVHTHHRPKLGRSKWFVQNTSKLIAFLHALREYVFDEEIPDSKRAAAIGMIAVRPLERDDIPGLYDQLMIASEGPGIHLAAIDLMAKAGRKDAPGKLIDSIPIATPKISEAIVGQLLQRDVWATDLLGACKDDPELVNRILPEHRQRLLSHENKVVKDLAQEIFASTIDADKSNLLESYAAAAQGDGNSGHGKVIFAEHCERCHRENDSGKIIGPDLAALTNRDPYWLLETILDPNRAIDSRYLNYIVQLVDGRVIAGLMYEETTSHITLQQTDGTSVTIPRKDIDELRSSGVSFMPDGLERDIDVAEMKDLIEYVVSFNRPAKTLPGNLPTVVTAKDDGSYDLTAATASIFGGDITFEETFQNIGYWHHERDHATWQVDVAKAGTYEVLLEYACPDNSSGNRFRVDGFSKRITGTVKPTGAWDQYREVSLGTAELLAGKRLIIVSPDGPVNQYLLDFRKLRLVPAKN